MNPAPLSRQGSRRAVLQAELGFTVLEALIAVALVTLVAFAGLAACKAVAHVMVASNAARSGVDAIEEQAGQLQNEAATAFAVFVPVADMNGGANQGQELDFYSKADDGRAIRWRYLYDSRARTLRRFDYDPAGVSGVRDVKTGTIDPSAAYPPLTNVTRFTAAAVAADVLGDPQRNVYAGIASLFARPPQALPVRYTGPGPNVPDAVGGNGIVQVSLADAASARVIHLAAGSMPTGFTVTGLPLWHAVVYRVDQTHRFLGGLAGKSHVFIRARVDVSYDRWAHREMWCDFTLLGDPDGLDGHDPHADYKPDEPIEQAENLLAACRARTPLPPPRPDSTAPAAAAEPAQTGSD